MFTKLSAILMALYLFFVGLFYGDQPIQIEYTYDIPSEVTVYERGDWVNVKVTATNVGRPFEGEEPFDLSVLFYQTIDGEIKPLLAETAVEDVVVESRPALIKKGDVNTAIEHLLIMEDAVPGSYDMKVTCAGCSQVFEDVITVI